VADYSVGSTRIWGLGQLWSADTLSHAIPGADPHESEQTFGLQRSAGVN
jgi:hypothetical protein